ncbi:MAG: hypothetical protein D8M58_22085 [Calditrichaeota bacterium]|nr:MAG: hypothetical protein DWQ03_08640 [Calditrichota bacterium]MBL1208103.1 hypothetical protein [Calditrichota bacterium]
MFMKLKSKLISCFFILAIIPVFIEAQQKTYMTEIDTIQCYPGKTLVQYKTYVDSLLSEDGYAFLYSTQLEVPRYKLFPYIFKKEISIDSMVYHGIVKSYFEDGKYRIGKYQNGTKIYMKYFDSTGTEISRNKYYLGIRIHFDPEKGNNHYLIDGIKED